MTDTVLKFEVKSKLAKLLATENIYFEHNPSSRSAYFDIKNRRLVLPVWKGISEHLYDMLIVHEVGHALDTPHDAWMEAIEEIAYKHHGTDPSDEALARIKDFINVVEDARIDKRQKRRYPGTKPDYAIGYKELHEKDFFGLSKTDVNALPLIDRLNVYFKNGAFLNISFAEDELPFIARMEKAETFAEVVKISADLYEKAIKDCNCSGSASSSKGEGDQPKELKVGILTDGDGNIQKNGSVKPSDFDVIIDARQNPSEDEGEGDDAKSAASSGDKESDEGDDTEGNESSTADGSGPLIIPASFTSDQMKKAMSKITHITNEEYVYVDIPTIDPSRHVDDWKVVISEMEESLYNKNVPRDFLSWKNNEKDTISYMVKEFELLKAADDYQRQNVAKTGMLDMNKIHHFRYNDDLFRKVTTVPKGKNHGFFIVLDWSGSMAPDIRHTIKRLFSLAMFCRRIQVPFEIYLFRSHNNRDGHWVDFPVEQNKAYLKIDPFRMRNILSSRMNANEFNNAMNTLYCFCHAASRSGYVKDGMHGTPLDQAILASENLINDFRQSRKLQIVNAIFLTDGGADGLAVREIDASGRIRSMYVTIGNKVFIFRDPKTKKVYYPEEKYFSNQKTTETLLDSLKNRVGCNLVGFYLYRGTYNDSSNVWGWNKKHDPAQEKLYNTEGFAYLNNRGYDEFYVMNLRMINKSDNDKDYEIGPRTGENVAARRFTQAMGARKVNRVMIKRFIKRIASEFH